MTDFYKKVGKKIVNLVLDVFIFILGIILIILLYKFFQTKILKNEYSSFFGYSTFEVQTGSMADEINAGDWIIVKSEKDIKVNDVITFVQDGEFITHRVVESYGGTFITKGDANNSKDEPITKEQIVGKVIKVLPLFGIFRKTLFNPIVLITLIPTLYLIDFLFRKNQKEKEEKEYVIKRIDTMLERIINYLKAIIDKVKKNIVQKNNIEKPKEVKKQIIVEQKEDVKFEQVNVPIEEEVSIEEINIEPMSEEELDKTMYFRAITVDKNEIDNTFLEISKNQSKEEEKEKRIEENKKRKEKKETLIVEEVDDSLVKSELELLQKKDNKKCKNVIEKVMYLKEKELEQIIELLNGDSKVLVNEVSIKNSFIKSYIDAKYYNFCGDINVEYNGRNMTVRIVEALNDVAKKMIGSYKGTDTKYEEKVNKYTNIFILIMYLEQANGKIEDLAPIKEMYKKKIIKFMKTSDMDDTKVKSIIEQIMKTQKVYQGMIKFTLKKLETNTFELNINQLSKNKNLYALALNHNISFSKVYSDYIVDKTYSEGVIAEDKVMIEATLLSERLVNDMLESEFNKKYIINVPASLYEKENKLTKFLSIIDDEFARNNVIMLVNYEDLISNKKIIKELKKSGYRFALVFDKTVELKAKDQSIISVAEFIFINKKKVDTNNILPNIPNNLTDKIIYEDIVSKVENYGGE